jgi:8-oxo-dGTP diphosphatase
MTETSAKHGLDDQVIEVCAALLMQGDKLLLAKRKMHLEQGGYWEFPGGKMEHQESPQQCLRRELREELGLDISIGNYFADSIYAYTGKTIRLSAWWVHCENVPELDNLTLTDHSSVQWLTVNQLESVSLAPADIPFIAKLQCTAFNNSWKPGDE